MVQAVGGTISRGDRPLQGSSGMVVQVGPHGCMGPPSTSGAGVGSRASIHRAEDACLLAAAWWRPLTLHGPGIHQHGLWAWVLCLPHALATQRPTRPMPAALQPQGRALLLAPSPVQASGQVASLPAANGLQLPRPMWAGGPPSGLDLTVKGEGGDPGPAPPQSSEDPEAGAHVQKQEAAPCQSPHGSGYPGV